MQNLHLLLSGGGYRATLFHLGVLRYLYEHRMYDQPEGTNALQSLSLVAGVSGGSITACHLAANFQRYTVSFGDPAGELIDFCRETDLRRKVLIEKSSVAAVLEETLFRDAPLLETMPTGLELVVLGTSYRTGDCIAFRPSGISQWQFNPKQMLLNLKHQADDAGICLSKLIQASAAFPPFFPPLKIEPTLFSSKPSNETLGDLFQDEVADGGIRDNLGYEWYRSAFEPDSNIALLISDAGQSFDWNASSRVSQGTAIWGQRLLRTTDIQMRRLGQLDVAAGAKLFADALYIGFVDCKDLEAEENLKLSLWSKPLPRGVGNTISKMSTDLTKIGPAQTYAIVKLGYNLAELKFGSIATERNDPSDSDRFWKRIFPESTVKRLLNKSDVDKESLEFHIKNEETPRVQGWVDLWKHVPMTRRQATWIYILAIVVAVPFLWGLVSICSFILGWIMSLSVRPAQFSYEQFLKTTKELDWESTCSLVEGNYLTVHGKLIDRRKTTIKMELDGLSKIVVIEVENDPKVEALPDTPDNESSDYLVVRGRVVKDASDTFSLSMDLAKVLDIQRKRPPSWSNLR